MKENHGGGGGEAVGPVKDKYRRYCCCNRQHCANRGLDFVGRTAVTSNRACSYKHTEGWGWGQGGGGGGGGVRRRGLSTNVVYNRVRLSGPRTIKECNELPPEATAADTLDTFVSKGLCFVCLFVLFFMLLFFHTWYRTWPCAD